MLNADAADTGMAGMKNEVAAVAGSAINSRSVEDTDSDQPKPKLYPKGWRLHTLTAG